MDRSPSGGAAQRAAIGVLAAALAVVLLLMAVAGTVPAFPLQYSSAGRLGILTVLWAVALLVVLARWLIAVRAYGLARAASGFGIVPFSAVAVGAAAFLMAAVNVPGVALSWAMLVIAASCAASFLLSWSVAVWRGRLSKSVLVLVYLGMSILLPFTFRYSDRWAGLLEAEETSKAAVSADKQGRGSDVTFERVKVGDDWRNAAVMSAGGFFFEELTATGGETLKFSVARSPEASGSLAITTAEGDAKAEIFRAGVTSIPHTAWQDVSVPCDGTGKLRIAFEYDSPNPGRVFVANSRLESSAWAVRSSAGVVREGGVNVILIVEDALRADRLGLYGSTKNLSPEMDSLASGAIVFDSCIAAAPWTRPSMASIFTSVYPSVHGVETFDGVLSPSFDTLAEVFQRAGYRTAAVQANVTLEAERGFAQGFDEYKLFRLLTPTAIDPAVNPRADVVTATALEWLRENGGSPFFLYIHYMDTHSPYCPPKEFAPDAESAEDFYDGAVRFFSSEFARLFEYLRSSRLLESSVVMFIADHGEQFEEHGDTEHGNSVHIEEVHVPLVVWSPGAKAGSKVGGLLSLVDVPVTLTELAGLVTPPGMQGVSFRKAIDGGLLDGRDVYSELLTYKVIGHRYIGLTAPHWRYIYDVMGAKDSYGRPLAGQLFNVAADPWERVNVSEANPALLQQMIGKVASFMASEAALGARLLPNRVNTPLSQEEIDKLTALGYISPSAGK